MSIALAYAIEARRNARRAAARVAGRDLSEAIADPAPFLEMTTAVLAAEKAARELWPDEAAIYHEWCLATRDEVCA
jgi:hypothetical protein